MSVDDCHENVQNGGRGKWKRWIIEKFVFNHFTHQAKKPLRRKGRALQCVRESWKTQKNIWMNCNNEEPSQKIEWTPPPKKTNKYCNYSGDEKKGRNQNIRKKKKKWINIKRRKKTNLKVKTEANSENCRHSKGENKELGIGIGIW